MSKARDLANGTFDTDTLVVDAANNRVGVGTSSPGEELHVYSSGSTTVQIESTGASSDPALLFTNDNGGASEWSLRLDKSASDVFQLRYNNSDVMTFDTSGNVGINTTSPDEELHVYSDNSPVVLIEAAAGNASRLRLLTPNDQIGYVEFGDSDDSDTGEIRYDHSTNHMGFHTNGNVERMRIDSSGNVGIGTATPNSYYANHLVVDTGSSAQSGITIVSDTTSQGMLAFADGTSGDQRYRGAIDYNHSNDRMAFLTGGAERMSINHAGQISMGNSSHADDILYLTRSNDGKLQRFFRGASEVGNISVTSTSTAYNTSSDARLKENVVDLTGASDRINQIPVHRFNFIADPDTTVDGFLAHEVQAVVPEAVTGTQDEVDEDGNPVYQSIDQSKIVPLLTAALQEALSEIADLKTRVAALETP